MATITDAELASLPPQRPQAVVMFRDRHRDYGTATTLAEKIGDDISRRWMARTWVCLARRQETLIGATT